MNTFLNKPSEKTYFILGNENRTDIRYGVCNVDQISTANANLSLIATFTEFESWQIELDSMGILVNIEDYEDETY